MFTAILYGCREEIIPASSPATQSMPEKSALLSEALFLDGESSYPAPSAAYIARSRVVKINLPLLLDENGRARELMGKTITLNLFPDVIYAGVIEQMKENGDSHTWIGRLKDVEYSGLTMIITEGIFIAKIASPEGVYEVSNIRGDLYRVILINQEKLPGGENAENVNPANP